jgi:hypothetical protein
MCSRKGDEVEVLQAKAHVYESSHRQARGDRHRNQLNDVFGQHTYEGAVCRILVNKAQPALFVMPYNGM